MTTLLESLADRRSEFASHLALANGVERCLFDGSALAIGETQVSVRHLLSIKSALIIHLYNIVESVMSRTMESVGQAVVMSQPGEWSQETLREWLRFNASFDLNGNEDTRLEVVHGAAMRLLGAKAIDRVNFKKPSGTWSDKLIVAFSKRLKVDFKLNREIVEMVKARPQYGDQTPLQFLADRRNAIAHGRKSFEQGAQDLSLADISELADATLGYMECAVSAFQSFVENKRYLTVNR